MKIDITAKPGMSLFEVRELLAEAIRESAPAGEGSISVPTLGQILDVADQHVSVVESVRGVIKGTTVLDRRIPPWGVVLSFEVGE